MVGPTMNLISGTRHSCEKKEYALIVLPKYTIIFPYVDMVLLNLDLYHKFGKLSKINIVNFGLILSLKNKQSKGLLGLEFCTMQYHL